ncbi:hypothetical protein [Methylosinus sp. Sm6]|uniref:hypothetical protein n=1 Tax=Methylosinus sp. Sm6 TaxID=2866948 RepID=UPI001C994D97|nr:hypothetical protein [Methylosinus sp. Sm6]MBY6240461.1 hypothetical protein [Methylosinus sp. Sm6]
MRLAFRLYGDFDWPPTLTPQPGSTKQLGTIEIYFALKTGFPDLRALVHWLPKGVNAEPETPDNNLYLVDDAPKWFADNRDKAASIWIDEEKETDKPDGVAFRGAFLIDQYSDGKPSLDLRWPLVSECVYRAGSTTHSELVVFRNEGHSLFRFNLHLPLPTRRSTLTSAGENNPAAFPFGAVYLTSRPAAAITDFTTLVGGWLGGGNASFKFDDDKLPHPPRLGAFGFSARRAGAGRVLVPFEGNRGVTPEEFWPTGGEAFLFDVLWRSGFNVPESKAWLRLEAVKASDQFLRVTGNELIYRMRIAVDRDPVPPREEDVRSYGGLGLCLARETGGWLRTASAVLVECRLTWGIDDASIFKDRDATWDLKCSFKLMWDEGVGDAFAGRPVDGEILTAGALAQGAYAMSAARAGLETAEAGQPQSFLPDLTGVAAIQTARFVLFSPKLPASFRNKDNLVEWGRPGPKPSATPKTVYVRRRLRLSLAALSDVISEIDMGVSASLEVYADGPNFLTGRRRCLFILRSDDNWRRDDEAAIESGEPFFASYLIHAKGPVRWSGHLSSLQFERTANSGGVWESWGEGSLRVGGPGARYGVNYGAAPIEISDGRVAVQLRLTAPLSRIEPVGVDVGRADRSGRPAPLLIPQSSSGSGGDARFHLIATETIGPTEDRLLEVEILDETAARETDRDYVVLSQEPFSLLRFTQRALGARGDLESASVANYSSNDRIWQFRRVTDYYHYVLPPQAVGESADKPRRLEIHDLLETSAETPPRPYVDDTDDAKKDLRRRAVEYRLIPAAEIWIRPSDVARGYFMPEQASYDIFRQRGEYGLGASLAFFRAEFLYGLTVGVDVARESSVARLARVAEIEALTGRVVGAAREKAADRALSGRWDKLSRVLARRQERLELWARDPESPVDFAPARFSEGVSFALRATALHRPAVLRRTADGPDELPADYGKPPQPQNDSGKPRKHPQGLSGGALWPVESANLFNILLARPDSRGGAIESIALSPLGGDASQKAEFLNGLVTILSETRNGHVERQKVEVLGRICAHWHRAKHVVIYERTVNASAQFAPKAQDDPQQSRSQRPILRKVREYVEILEPERAYPDFPNAAPRSAGFLDRVRFNSKIINVDSAWSTDVEDYGWRIPLWNRLSARERPQVYPMPDVAFVTVAEGDGDRPTAAQECLDLDYLFFFADLKATTSDTNQWPSRLGLDFVNMPYAKAIYERFDPKRTDDPASSVDARQQSVSRILPGLRRFTWRLAPAAQKTAINAGRAGKPVFVGLQAVTFMRASYADAKPLQSNLKEALNLNNQGAIVAPEINSLEYWSADGQNAAIGNDSATKLKALKDELIAAAGAHNADDVKRIKRELDVAWPDLSGAVVTALKQRPDPLKDRLRALANIDIKKLTSGVAFCEKVKTDAVGQIRRKEMLICTAISDLAADADKIIAGLPHISQKTAVIENMVGQVSAHISPLFSDISHDLGNVREGVEKARAVLVDAEIEFEALIARARQRVEQYASAYDRDKPWSDQRRRAFLVGLQACVGNVAGEVESAVGEARQRLAVELSEVSQSIAGNLAKELAAISSNQAQALAGLVSARKAVDCLFHDFHAPLDALAPEAGAGLIDNALARFDPASQAVAAIKDNNDERLIKLKQRGQDALAALRQVALEARAQAPKARAALESVEQAADNGLTQISEAIAMAGSELAKLAKLAAGKDAELLALAAEFAYAGFTEVQAAFAAIWPDVDQQATALTTALAEKLIRLGDIIEPLVVSTRQALESALADIQRDARVVPERIAPVADDVAEALEDASTALSPSGLMKQLVIEKAVRPALVELLGGLPEDLDGQPALAKAGLRNAIASLSETVGRTIRKLTVAELAGVDEVSQACSAVYEDLDRVSKYAGALAGDVQTYLDEQLQAAHQALNHSIDEAVGDLPNKAEKLIKSVKAFDRTVRGLQNDLSRSVETAGMYADRVFAAAGHIGDGGLMAAPSNVLKLYSAVSSAPEIASLKADIDRIRSGYNELSDIIDTTETKALFNVLGDELKALGLSLNFDKIGDRLLPVDLSKFEFASVFRNLGGVKFDKLLSGCKLPTGMADAIKVTHDFDKAQARAWVQVDIKAPIFGRRNLFAVGPFAADFIDMTVTGQVRLEASKDQSQVTESGFGRIDTTIDTVVGGQSMVRFEKFALAFTREKGLQVEFDPKNIRLNPSFKFIQDFLSTLFPDEIGGLKVIKIDGIPVGVEHEFAMPPIALNFGTSGVSNIAIGNRFKLAACPEFVLANRFNLSTIERPFIFSIFIIGGAGYVQVDAEYRPFDSELSVAVEASAGGSASLAFAFGPFSGQVFITLSAALSYRKTLGRPGGGLTVAAVLVIAGHVDVVGIVTVGIVVMLRMTYRDSGQVDADGSLTVEIRISRLFKISARAGVRYKLRGGRSETMTQTGVTADVSQELRNKAKSLQGARS